MNRTLIGRVETLSRVFISHFPSPVVRRFFFSSHFSAVLPPPEDMQQQSQGPGGGGVVVWGGCWQSRDAPLRSPREVRSRSRGRGFPAGLHSAGAALPHGARLPGASACPIQRWEKEKTQTEMKTAIKTQDGRIAKRESGSDRGKLAGFPFVFVIIFKLITSWP